MRQIAYVSLAFLCLSACHHESQSGNDDAGTDMNATVGDGFMPVCQPGLVSLSLSPPDSMGTLDGGTPAPIDFTATGTFSDGHTEALDPNQLGWSVTRPDATPPGMISGGTLTPNGSAGGVLTVTATDGCVTGSTTLTLKLNVTIGTPANPADWTGTPVSTGTIPTMVYPSDQTRFPRNIYRTLFQWRTGGYAQFRLTFTGAGSTVTVYTDGANPLCAGKTPAAGCWEADEEAWQFIAGSNAGATVEWTVDALDTSTAPPTIRRGLTPTPASLDKVTIGFSKQDVVGAVFYWSTTSAGIRRANIADAAPEDYITGVPGTTYTSPADKVKCVACHVVSRDGKYMAAPVSATSGDSLWIMEVTKDAPPNPLVKSIANTKGHGFATISPDDATVVAAWGGKMWTVDRATGAFGANITLSPFSAGTHPDWSPDNSQLVFATGNGDAPSNCNIALLPYTNPGWGTPQTLVAAAGLSNLFPMFSPDGKWIAYSRGKGGHGDLTAQLWVVGGQIGGAAPVELKNANRMVSGVFGNGQTENSQPTWAPPGDLYWIAFNSQREYGVVSKAGTQQIWVAAVDPSKLGGTDDPSFPAFRLQFQGLNEDNHRAFWTLDVRDTPVPDMGTFDLARTCVAAGAMCDPAADCCPPGYQCDTTDNGATYTCVQGPIL